ncbi:ATP-binding domain-containing protein, partial [Granulosicoccus sp.]
QSDRGQSRVENVEELANAARTYVHHAADDPDLNALDEFLAHAALEAGEGQADADDNAVQLMTLHSAKGLEFPVVFMAGMEQGLFPHQRSAEDPVRMEEERRLCYVGITRAEKKLYMTMAEQRRLYGRDQYNPPSKFVAELPAELLEEIRPRMQVSMPVYRREQSYVQEEYDTGLSIGQMVQHGKFGVGIVLDQEGQGKQARVQVNFQDAGSKWLVLAYANLQPA